ncbi:carboxypeptidase-like regulatory domain-containing protein [Echinicola salinicaeni]|uniref:carboxypeptidase-like regulatory domain-containing protein n=1 Tax=Echinicola salinicaeni TaxID=2762757 RepID=UPI001C94FBA8
MKITNLYFPLFLFFFLFIAGINTSYAQDSQDKKVIQLSGIILNADSTTAISGVNVYVPNKGRGTSSNNFGYFSMPVATGDSVVFSFVGLKNQSFKVPDTVGDDKISLILTMAQDEIALGEVEVMPYPTEEEFKQAVLAMTVDEIPLDRGNLSPQMLLRWAEQMPSSANENFRSFQSGQMQQIQDRYGPRSFPLLNPFAWANFIKSIKRGDLKSKD